MANFLGTNDPFEQINYEPYISITLQLICMFKWKHIVYVENTVAKFSSALHRLVPENTCVEGSSCVKEE